MSFEFNVSTDVIDGEGSYQGDLASSYTNEMTAYLQSDEGADFAAFLAHMVNGLSVEEALAVKTAIMSGSFQLSGLFSAAQDKTGYVDDDAITDPTPTLTVNGIVIDLTAMLEGTDTAEWNSITTIKKIVYTTYHTREFYTDSKEPEGYSSDWSSPPVENQAPTAEAITWGMEEFDNHASGNDASGVGTHTESIDLLSTAADPDGDTLSVVADSVTLEGGGALPGYIVVDYSTGEVTIDTNSDAFKTLYDDEMLDLKLVYQITDGTTTIDNTVDLTITGTADQFTQSTDITSSVTTFNSTTWDGSLNFTISDAPTAAFDFTGTATVTVVGDIDGVAQAETVTVTFEGGDSAILGMTSTGNKEPTNPNYPSGGYSDTDFVDFASSDTAVSGSYDSNTLGGADGVDQLTSVQVTVTEYQYWL